MNRLYDQHGISKNFVQLLYNLDLTIEQLTEKDRLFGNKENDHICAIIRSIKYEIQKQAAETQYIKFDNTTMGFLK